MGIFDWLLNHTDDEDPDLVDQLGRDLISTSVTTRSEQGLEAEVVIVQSPPRG